MARNPLRRTRSPPRNRWSSERGLRLLEFTSGSHVNSVAFLVCGVDASVHRKLR
jgi:hypothetical protein